MWLSTEQVQFVIRENQARRDNKGFVVMGSDTYSGPHIWIADDGVWVFNTFDEALECVARVKNPTLTICVKPIMELE